MKVLRPTLREKRRWIVAEFYGGSPDDPVRWVVKTLKRNLGEILFARAGVKVRKEGEKILISAARDFVDLVRASLILHREPFVVRTVVGGTVKSLKRRGFL